MRNNTLALKSLYMEQLYRADHLQERVDELEESIGAFFTGTLPENSSISTLILASWGRKRLDSLKKTPALLQRNV